MKSPKTIIPWMMFLFSVLTLTIWALVTVTPPKKPDCSKVIDRFSHYLGIGTIAEYAGNDITGFKKDMQGVIRKYPSCFPEALVAEVG